MTSLCSVGRFCVCICVFHLFRPSWSFKLCSFCAASPSATHTISTVWHPVCRQVKMVGGVDQYFQGPFLGRKQAQYPVLKANLKQVEMISEGKC